MSLIYTGILILDILLNHFTEVAYEKYTDPTVLKNVLIYH